MAVQEFTFSDGSESAPAAEHIFTLAELREHKPRELSDAAKYTDEKLEKARKVAEEGIEHACKVAFVPRSRTEKLVGPGSDTLVVGGRMLRSVSAVSVDDVALTADELAALKVREWGGVVRPTGWDRDAEISITYEHGYAEPPARVKNAALILAADIVVPSSIPARATAQTLGDQFFRVTIAGRDGRFGIPEVDAVVAEYGHGDDPAVG